MYSSVNHAVRFDPFYTKPLGAFRLSDDQRQTIPPEKAFVQTFVSITGSHPRDLWNGTGGGSGEDSLHEEQRKASRLTPNRYCLVTRSSTRIPNATTIATDPMKFQNVTTSIPAPNTTSDANTSTVVRRFPMDAMMGPHTPKRICTGRSLNPG